jgi:hypothetical protein
MVFLPNTRINMTGVMVFLPNTLLNITGVMVFLRNSAKYNGCGLLFTLESQFQAQNLSFSQVKSFYSLQHGFFSLETRLVSCNVLHFAKILSTCAVHIVNIKVECGRPRLSML